MKAVVCRLLAFSVLAASIGCGSGSEKAVIPEKFTPPPDGPPSAGGVPGGGTKKGKGKVSPGPGGGGAAEQ